MVRQVKYRVKQNELLLALGDWKKIQSRPKQKLDGHGDKASVCTFHSLGFRILRAENEASIGFRPVHDGEQLDLFQQSMKYTGLEEDPADVLSKVMVELVRLLSQPHGNLWLAGDDDQSIHGFRGARSDIFVSL
jgi:superfamily I DNA/RNA helicase